MAELDAVLTELGRHVEFPPTPNLAPAVRRRLGERRSWRRPVVVALAVLVVAIGAALAVPAARTAILDWLGLRTVHIVRVEKLPPAPVIGNLDLGRPVTLAEARRRAPWLLVPADEPDGAYISTAIPGGKVSLLWGTPASVRLLLTEFRGQETLHREADRAEYGGRAGRDRRHRSLARAAARPLVPRPRRPLPSEHGPAGGQDAHLATGRRDASARGRALQG